MDIYTICFAGIDDKIAPKELAELSDIYPFVEWGVLLSPSHIGTINYPTREWLEELSYFSSRIRLSAHFSDQWESDIIENLDVSFKKEYPKIWPLFKRIRLDLTKYNKISNKIIDTFHLIKEKQIILKVENLNDKIYKESQKYRLDVVPLLNIYDNIPNVKYLGLTAKCDNDSKKIINRLSDIEGALLGKKVWIELKLTNSVNHDEIERCLDLADEYISHDTFASTYMETSGAKQKVSDSLRPPPISI